MHFEYPNICIKITSLWKLGSNGHQKRHQAEVYFRFKHLSEKILLSQKLRYFRGSHFSQCFSTALGCLLPSKLLYLFISWGLKCQAINYFLLVWYPQVFIGNTDDSDYVTNPLLNAIDAVYLRLVPTSVNSDLSSNVKVYGCASLNTADEAPSTTGTWIQCFNILPFNKFVDLESQSFNFQHVHVSPNRYRCQTF